MTGAYQHAAIGEMPLVKSVHLGHDPLELLVEPPVHAHAVLLLAVGELERHPCARDASTMASWRLLVPRQASTRGARGQRPILKAYAWASEVRQVAYCGGSVAAVNGDHLSSSSSGVPRADSYILDTSSGDWYAIQLSLAMLS